VGQYLRFLARDSATNSVALFIEGFRDPPGFVEGAGALRAAGKPLAVLQAGRTEDAAGAIAAHSGSLAGRDEVITGLLHQVGAMGVDDLDELFEVAELMGHGRLPRGRRLFVITDSGGEARLVADQAGGAGLELPVPSAALAESLRRRWPHFSYIGNPIDPWGVDPDFVSLYAEVARVAAREDVDVLAVALDKVTPWAGRNEVELGEAAAAALIDACRGVEGSPMPVFFTVHATGPAVESIREALRAAGVPLLHGLRPTMVALRRAWFWQWWKPRTRPAWLDEPPVPLAFEEMGPVLSEAAGRAVLSAYGIPVVPGAAAATEDEAAEAADRIGFPVVVKADVIGIAHKAAGGMVALRVATVDASRRAFRTVTHRAAAAGARPRGVLVQATASGVELIAGMRRDPLFGPVVLIGVGGTLTEAVGRVAVRVCPPSLEDLDEMLDECPVGRIIEAAGAQREPVRMVLAALARMALDHPDVAEVDVNPLFAGPDGVVAADALVVRTAE
jgi:acetyltransferase